MNIKIVADSAADLTALQSVPFMYAPLKICTAEREFVDDDSINVREMVDFLYSYKDRSSTSCPNPEDWLSAFGEEENILCLTITGGLSGSYNAACAAKEIYEDTHKGRRVSVIDTRSAGPEIALMILRAEELVREGKNLDEITAALQGYKTELLFALESLKNFANNGRVSKVAATAAGLLGIRAIGRASDEGTLELLGKARGAAKTQETILGYLKQYGYKGGKLRIHHCYADEVVESLTQKIHAAYPSADITVLPTRGLCSYYAEVGGILVGYEV